ncbi:MAG: ribonuclease HII [Patescibacteria group bacterium]
MFSYYLGIDEVGRGPVAGPLTVAGVLMPITEENWPRKDSKKLTLKQRLSWYDFLLEKKNFNHWQMAEVSIKPIVIDKVGLSYALAVAVNRLIEKINFNKQNTLICLDAGLPLSTEFNCLSFPQADEKMPAVALASVLAKVRRDKRMDYYHRLYSDYGFDRHKGYGTAYHFTKIKEFGLSPIHRRSFLKRLKI